MTKQRGCGLLMKSESQPGQQGLVLIDSRSKTSLRALTPG
jgi:hypothetical protein